MKIHFSEQAQLLNRLALATVKFCGVAQTKTKLVNFLIDFLDVYRAGGSRSES